MGYWNRELRTLVAFLMPFVTAIVLGAILGFISPAAGGAGAGIGLVLGIWFGLKVEEKLGLWPVHRLGADAARPDAEA